MEKPSHAVMMVTASCLAAMSDFQVPAMDIGSVRYNKGKNQGSLKWTCPGFTKTVRCGRNDPCVCGSGKKFKQCCWSNK